MILVETEVYAEKNGYTGLHMSIVGPTTIWVESTWQTGITQDDFPDTGYVIRTYKN